MKGEITMDIMSSEKLRENMIKTYKYKGIRCENDNCKNNEENICTLNTKDIVLDLKGRCKNYSSKMNCIVCGREIKHDNSEFGDCSDVCHWCTKLIETDNVRIIEKAESKNSQNTEGAFVSKWGSKWKVIRAKENEKYIVFEKVFNT